MILSGEVSTEIKFLLAYFLLIESSYGIVKLDCFCRFLFLGMLWSSLLVSRMLSSVSCSTVSYTDEGGRVGISYFSNFCRTINFVFLLFTWFSLHCYISQESWYFLYLSDFPSEAMLLWSFHLQDFAPSGLFPISTAVKY